MTHHVCKSCRERFTFDIDRRRIAVERVGGSYFKGEGEFCRECADEWFRGILRGTPAYLDSTGRGCPLEPGDDNDPGQENAIRVMEGDK